MFPRRTFQLFASQLLLAALWSSSDTASAKKKSVRNQKACLEDVLGFDLMHEEPAHDRTQISDEGAQLLGEALNDGRCLLSELDLRNHGIGPEGVASLMIALQTAPPVTKLILDGNPIESGGAAAIASALSENKLPSLTELHLKGCGGRAMSDTGLHSSSGLGPDGVVALFAGMKAGCGGLITLEVQENDMQDEGALAIVDTLSSGSCKLTELNAMRNGIGPDGVAAFEQVIRRSKLKRLNLSWNSGGDKAAVALAERLGSPEGSPLISLQMSDNGITDIGAEALAKAIESGHCRLKNINLVENKITNQGAEAFIVGLQAQHDHGRHQLGYVGLYTNPGIDAATMKRIERVMNEAVIERGAERKAKRLAELEV